MIILGVPPYLLHTQDYPRVRGMVHDVHLWDHSHPDVGGSDDAGRSRSNPWEAAAAVSLAKYLLQQDYAPGAPARSL